MRVRTVDGRTADFAAGRYGGAVVCVCGAYHNNNNKVKLHPFNIFPYPRDSLHLNRLIR